MDGILKSFLTDKSWRKFATENDLAVATVVYRSVPTKDASAILEVEKLITPALRDAKVATIPRLLFGQGYGGSLVVRLVASEPRNIAGWATLGALDWVEPRNPKASPPGLVACGEAVQSGHEGGQQFVRTMREREARIAWTAIRQLRGHQHQPTEQLVRAIFSSPARPTQAGNWNRRVHIEQKRGDGISPRPDRADVVAAGPRDIRSLASRAHSRQPHPGTVQTGIPEMPTITFALRLPTGG